MTTTTISERSTGWIFYKRMWKMLRGLAAGYSPALQFSPTCLNNNYFFRSNDLMGSVEEVTYCILYQGLRKRMLFRYTTMWNGFKFD